MNLVKVKGLSRLPTQPKYFDSHTDEIIYHFRGFLKPLKPSHHAQGQDICRSCGKDEVQPTNGDLYGTGEDVQE